MPARRAEMGSTSPRYVYDVKSVVRYATTLWFAVYTHGSGYVGLGGLKQQEAHPDDEPVGARAEHKCHGAREAAVHSRHYDPGTHRSSRRPHSRPSC